MLMTRARQISMAEGLMPGAIHDRLLAEFPYAQIPTVRTIFSWIDGFRPLDPRALWFVQRLNAREAAIVLPVLGEVLIRTEGKVGAFSNAEAEWLVTLTDIAPDLPAMLRLILARFYALLDSEVSKDSDHSRQVERAASDLFLALAPWRSPDAARQYNQAIAEGWIPAHPLIATDVDIPGVSTAIRYRDKRPS
jgi:hypothetical protein